MDAPEGDIYRAPTAFLGRCFNKKPTKLLHCSNLPPPAVMESRFCTPPDEAKRIYTGTAVVAFTRSSTKLVLQSCTLGCLSSVSMMKRL
jgi:hypothetical protein